MTLLFLPLVQDNASHVTVAGTGAELLTLIPAQTETSTPSEAQLLSLAQSKNAEPGNRFHYDDGEGYTIKGQVIDDGAGGILLDLETVAYRIYDQVLLPDVEKFAEGTLIVHRSGGVDTLYSVDPAPKAWNDEGAWGASGGGGPVTEVDTLATVTSRGGVSTGDIEIAAGSGLIITDDGGQRVRMTLAADDSIVTNPV